MEYGLLITGLLAAILYLNTLPAEFAYDDSRAILKNPDLLPSTPLTSLLYDDFWGTPLTHSGSHKSYRPLCVLTFRLNYALGGLQPWGYHLGNVLLHAVVTATFTHTAHVVLGRRGPAITAGLLFAAHPIHTEAVAGIVGRADILSCLFFLLAFLCYTRYCHHRRPVTTVTTAVTTTTSSWWLRLVWLAGVALCSLAAMLSKELGVTVLAVCAVYDLVLVCKVKVKDILKVTQASYRPLLEGLLSLGAIGSSLVLFRVLCQGARTPEFAPADNPASDADSLLTRALTYHYLPALNLWLLLCPRTLSFDWSMGAVPLVESLWDARNLATVAMYGTLGYTAWYLCKYLNVEDDTQTKRLHNGYHENGHSVVTNGNYLKHSNGSATTQLRHSNGTTPRHSNGTATTPRHSNGTVTTHRKSRHHRRGSGSSTDSSVDSLDSHTSTSHASPHTPATGHGLRTLTLSLALLVCPFLPATNLFFYVGFVVAERVLYIPSLGFCLLVTQGIDTLGRARITDTVHRSRLVTLLVALLVAAYGVRTVVRNQDWTTEEQLYRAGIQVNPAKAWGNLANILNNQGKHHEAEEAYRSALQHRGNMADVHYNLGILLQEQKRYQEAMESYRLAIQCRPRLTMAHLNLGIVYASLHLRTEAEEMYRRCSEIDITGLKDPRLHEQTKISALYNLGRLLADQERYSEAIVTYQEAIRRRPPHYAPQSLYNMLGEAYSKLDQLSEAERWYQEALKAKPEHIPAHLTMGKLLLRKGRLVEAESWFERARDIDPTDSSVYQHYGQFLSDIGRHGDAAESYQRASQYNPTDFELVFNTANAFRQAQRDLDAEEYYAKAVRLRPKEATAHMNLGAMLHFNGKLHEAEQSYLAALELKPDDAITRNNLQKVRNLISKRGHR